MGKSEIKFWLSIKGFSLLVLLSVLTVYAICVPCWSFTFIPWNTLFQSALIWICLGYGNGFISSKLDQRASWIQQTYTRLFLGFIAMVTYTFLAVYGLSILFSWWFNMSILNPSNPTTWLITLLMTVVMSARSFLISWRQSAINEERLKSENMKSRFETLKNQVNPHFLFNSFNVLTELVYQDADKAADFIQQLSAVYRYVLEKRDHELVSLEDELSFLENYIFLQQIRFQEGLRIDIRIQHKDARIPPMTLQMLIENAIKHNVVSEEEPLHIQILEEDNYIKVMNNIQEKRIPQDLSSGIGLSNIQGRYRFLSEKEVEISKSETTFTVRLPLIKTKEYAHSAY